ncbi:TPA: PTS mannose transporter subunit IIAB [Escherichia coli]
MTIAIVIGTHGWAAEQLLKTAEMLLGEQENVGWIDFVPGENAETLIEKYNAQLAKLDTTKGVLFLVDTWGGSPFNAASRIVVDKEHYEVIAGVNIPMLVETLMARDDDPSFDELVALAVETGREGVKALKAKPVEKAAPAPAAAAPKAAPTPAKPMGPNDYMVIGLARIDDRLIHGQVATRWTKETNVSRIIVVSDEVAADTVRKTLLTQVAPPGVTAHVVDVAKMIRVYNNPKYAGERVMLLFTNPTDVERLVEGGVKIGDMKTGIIIGGTLEMIALGWMNIGAAVAPDAALASIISTILVIAGHQSIGAGIALAIPLAAAGQVLTIIVRTITVAFQHAADKAADNGNLTAISWIHVSSLFLQAMRVAIPAVIVALSVGTSEVQNMLNAIPEVVTNGLNIAGGMIVVVGYAMVINMMRAGYLMPFFYLGFVTAAFTNFNLVALGVIGTVMAVLYIQLSPKYNRVAGAPAQAAGNNDLDNELD